MIARSLVTLTTTGAIFGVSMVGFNTLVGRCPAALFGVRTIASPLHHARRAIYMHRGAYPHPWIAAWDGIFSVGLMAVVAWFAYTHVPQVHDFIQHFPSVCLPGADWRKTQGVAVDGAGMEAKLEDLGR